MMENNSPQQNKLLKEREKRKVFIIELNGDTFETVHLWVSDMRP